MRNFSSLIAFLILLCFAFGCGLIERFKTKTETNSAAPSPTVSATPAPAPSPSATAANTSDDEIIKTQKNFFAFGAGASIADKSSEDEFKPARKLIDEARGGSEGWFSAEGQTANQFVVIELPARATLKNIVFDNNGFDYENRFAKDVSVEMSDVSAKEGFQKILDATLEKDKAEQIFPVTNQVSGRFVRVNFLSNYGSPKAVQLREIRGYGEQEAQKLFENASGSYLENDFKKFHLKQEGSLITGCFEDNKKIISGTIEGRTITYVAAEPGKPNKDFAVVSLAPDGSRYEAAKWDDTYGDTKLFDNIYTGKKTSDKIGNCSQMPDLDGAKDAAKDELENSLEKTGRATLYGINFDFNSDVIRPESRPTLEKVAAILKENKDWKMQIEGHTDNIGGESFNRTLSEKRAAAVVKFLTDTGIEASRLSSQGAGLSKPVASNETETGRAQNRRVEIIKQ
jgi:outer membrane protein OmpA-like peptidoglycan-associated protein